ncbi:hypothetical protein C8J57DRAFT_1528079 [Mycena rebaudengoi]|nr:hypothetical protein C8J57DRAFT_1528079 [Mycena rebaudengoi]
MAMGLQPGARAACPSFEPGDDATNRRVGSQRWGVSLPRLHPAHPAHLLSWFLDSLATPFGVHRMARADKALGKDVGMWLGPSAAVGAMRTLVDAFPACGLDVSVATDSTLYQTEVYAASHIPVACHRRLLVAPLAWSHRELRVRAGNAKSPATKKRRGDHQVGIAGGPPGATDSFTSTRTTRARPSRSFAAHTIFGVVILCIGAPRVARRVPRAADELVDDASGTTRGGKTFYRRAYSPAELRTFHCEKVRTMPLSGLDPSMVIGFARRDAADLRRRIALLPRTIFAIQDDPPTWMGADDDDERGGRASLTRRKSAWTPRGRTTGRAACAFFDKESSSASHGVSVRTCSEEGADTEDDPVAPITLLPATTRFDLSGEPKERDGAGEKGKAGSPFPEEDGFVDVDKGRENDNGDDIEDDWVDPVPSPPAPAPLPVKKSKSGSGKSKEGKENKGRTEAAAVPVPSVHYPFPVSVEDGATGGGQQQQRADERGRGRQRNVTVSPRPPAQGHCEGHRACMPRARVTAGVHRAVAYAFGPKLLGRGAPPAQQPIPVDIDSGTTYFLSPKAHKRKQAGEDPSSPSKTTPRKRRKKGQLWDPQTKKFNLAAYEFRETFERKFDDEGRFGRYVSDGHKFTATIVAEVGSEKEGSWFAAYPKNAPPANKLPLNDNSSSHRMVIAARSPTAAPEEIVRNWNDSLATVDGVRGVDADDEANNNEKFHKITEWVVNADSNSTEPGNLIILRLPPTYEVNYFLLLISAQATPKRRARVVKSTATPKKTEDVDMTASLTERRIGDTYDPNLLPDHRGPYFNHKDAKLIQRDIRDHDDTLIAPHESSNRRHTLYCPSLL